MTATPSPSLFEDGNSHVLSSNWIPGMPVWAGTRRRRPVAVHVRMIPNGFELAYRGIEVKAFVYTEREARYARLMPAKKLSGSEKAVRCPMPGLVVSIAVAEGQEVKAGETLAVVEAMKMENVLRAERDGIDQEDPRQAGRQRRGRRRDHGVRVASLRHSGARQRARSPESIIARFANVPPRQFCNTGAIDSGLAAERRTGMTVGPNACTRCAYCSRQSGRLAAAGRSSSPSCPFYARRVGLARAHLARRHQARLVCGRSWPRSDRARLDLVRAARETAARRRQAGAGLAVGVGLLYVLSVVLLVIVAAAFFYDRWPRHGTDPNTRERARPHPASCRSSPCWPARPHDSLAWLIVAILLVIAFLPMIVAVVIDTCGLQRGRRRRLRGVMLHFAYGSNMSRAVMRRHAPDAEPIGVAALADHRFLITATTAMPRSRRFDAARSMACYGGSRRATASRSTPGRISPAGFIVPRCCRCGSAGAAPAGAGLSSRGSQAGRPGEGRLYGACDRGGAEWKLPPAYILVSDAAEAAARGGSRKLGEFRWT